MQTKDPDTINCHGGSNSSAMKTRKIGTAFN